MNAQLSPLCSSHRISSKEIAETLNKQHPHVLRSIRKLIEAGAITASTFGLSEYIDTTGRKLPIYELDFYATMVLITGYDAGRRAKVIQRWMQVENGEASPAVASPIVGALTKEVLLARPLWKEIARYKKLGLNGAEIGRLTGLSKDTIRSHTRRMEACHIIEPSAKLGELRKRVAYLPGILAKKEA